MSQYVVVAGTRPEVIKVAPIIRKLLECKLNMYFVHTGQHFDYSLSEQMIHDLHLPVPEKIVNIIKKSVAESDRNYSSSKTALVQNSFE